MAGIHLTLSDIQKALEEIGKAEQEYTAGKEKIENIVRDVNDGKIGGSAAAQLLEVFGTLEPEFGRMKKIFAELNQVFKNAERGFIDVTDEASAQIAKNAAR